jgi:cytochrome c-type biogenesis protein CcsB
MIFDGFIKNFIYDPVSFIGILIFYFLLINLPISLIALFNKKSSSYVRLITILINLFIALQLISRWIISGHFPISNLYESLYFLVWGITLGQLLIEKEYSTPIIPAIAIPIELLTIAFACFVLPEDLKLSSNLVPALRSSWLVMHVSVVMLSYAALIIGSLLSASVLFINNSQPLQLRSSSMGVGGFKISNSYSTSNVIEPINFSHSEELDTLSYRSILVGFVLLTLGLITGAIWANEAWGTWWSWDPKETWAFISWLFYAAYLHMRISRGWQGRRPALLATSGFFVVLICYIGVNFLGVGLHSYGWIFGIFNLF